MLVRGWYYVSQGMVLCESGDGIVRVRGWYCASQGMVLCEPGDGIV